MIIKLVKHLQKKGIVKTFNEISIGIRSKYFFHSYRKSFNKIIYSKFKGLVTYGPFKGMYISSNTQWNNFDIVPKLLGTYERHIQEEIINIINKKNKNSIFIDIGAADGFYAVGVSMQKKIDKTIAFEINSKSKDILILNALRNNVRNKIKIFDKASKNLIFKHLNYKDNFIILIDIEGAEYDLLDKNILEKLSQIRLEIIIELHEFTDDQKLKSSELIQNSAEFFRCKFIKPMLIDNNKFDILNSCPDDMRYISFSEKRPALMRWIRLTPKQKNAFKK
tara:strand:- start:2868 stop:3704 length:837 start_codon:yes stop_codon:yes gene_type:complete